MMRQKLYLWMYKWNPLSNDKCSCIMYTWCKYMIPSHVCCYDDITPVEGKLLCLLSFFTGCIHSADRCKTCILNNLQVKSASDKHQLAMDIASLSIPVNYRRMLPINFPTNRAYTSHVCIRQTLYIYNHFLFVYSNQLWQDVVFNFELKKTAERVCNSSCNGRGYTPKQRWLIIWRIENEHINVDKPTLEHKLNMEYLDLWYNNTRNTSNCSTKHNWYLQLNLWRSNMLYFYMSNWYTFFEERRKHTEPMTIIPQN